MEQQTSQNTMDNGPKKMCKACRAVIDPKAEICPQCGVRQFKPINKVALLLFTFFIGGFGAHKFYLGKFIQGVFYVLFSWTMIPSLIAFIEFIIYACTSEDRLQERYPESSGGAALAAVIGLVGFIMFIGVLAAIAIPQFVSYRSRAVCMTVENEAQMASMAISQYLVDSDAQTTPSLEELSQATGYVPNQQIGIEIQKKQHQVVVMASDLSGQCKQGSVFFLSIPTDDTIDGWQ